MSEQYETPQEPVVGDAPPQANVLLSNSLYDNFMSLSLLVLPIFATAYFGLAQIWGFPMAEQVLGTVAVIETLIGGLMRISKVQYENSDARFDGSITVSPGENEDTSNLNVSLDPAAIADKDEIVVKVKRT